MIFFHKLLFQHDHKSNTSHERRRIMDRNAQSKESSSKPLDDTKQSYASLAYNPIEEVLVAEEEERCLESSSSSHEDDNALEVVAENQNCLDKNASTAHTKTTATETATSASSSSPSASNAVVKRCNSVHTRLQEARRQSFPLLSHDLVEDFIEDLEESSSTSSSYGDGQVLDFMAMEASILQVNKNEYNDDGYDDSFDDGYGNEEEGGRCHNNEGEKIEEVEQVKDREIRNRLEFDLGEEEREFKLDLSRSKLDRMSLVSDLTSSLNSVMSEFEEMENILDEMIKDVGNHKEMLTKDMEEARVPHQQTQQQHGGSGNVILGNDTSKVASGADHDIAAGSSSLRSSFSSSGTDDSDLLDFLNDLPRKSRNIDDNEFYFRMLALDFDQGNEDNDGNTIQKFFGYGENRDSISLAKQKQIGHEIDRAEPRDSVDVMKLRQVRKHEKWSNSDANGSNYAICDAKNKVNRDHYLKQHNVDDDDNTATTITAETMTSSSTFVNRMEREEDINNLQA